MEPHVADVISGSRADSATGLGDRVVAARALERVGAQRVVEQPVGDVVEHDRGDHLVRPGAGLEGAGDRAPTPPPPANPARTASGRWIEGRQVQGEADLAGAGGADDELAGGADVEQAGAEGQGHRQAGERQRGGLDQRAADGAAASPASCATGPGRPPTPRPTRPRAAPMGSAENSPHSLSVSGSVKMITSPPTTRAVNSASTGHHQGAPARRSHGERPRPGRARAGGRAAVVGLGRLGRRPGRCVDGGAHVT